MFEGHIAKWLVIFNEQKTYRWRIEIDDERAVMLANAIGLAVMEMRSIGVLLTEYTLAEKLDDMRQRETNVIGKGVYRDAAEIVRTGRLPLA